MTAPVSLSAKPSWMQKDFRYAPSSPEAVAARERCVPGPDWVPNLQAENRRLVAEVERLRAASPAPSMVGLREKVHDLILTGLYFPCDTITDEEDDAIFRTTDAILALLAREGE